MAAEAIESEHEPFLPDGSSPLDEKKHSSHRLTLRSLAFWRRWSRILIGAVFAVLVLSAHSYFLESRASPRAIATSGWEKAQDALFKPKDEMRDFYREQGCNVSSLELHQPFKPLCKDRRSLLTAMSGGGRAGWDRPYQTLDCDMQWLSTSQICKVFSKFDHIYLFGDSLMRHLQDALHVLLRGDLVNGARATWRQDTESEPRNCTCRNIFDYRDCFWWSVPSTSFLIDGDPKSIPCRADQRPALITYIPVPDFPLDPSGKDSLKMFWENITKPTGRDVLVFGSGLWNNLAPDRTMSWIEELEELLGTLSPALYERGLKPSRLVPRLYMAPTSQGIAKPAQYRPLQNNLALQEFTTAMAPFMEERGIEFLGLFNLTAQHTSPDGTHAGMEVNLMKAQMLLNWINMLEPEPITTSRPPIPTTPIDLWKTDHPLVTTALPKSLPNDVAPDVATHISEQTSSDTTPATVSNAYSSLTSVVATSLPVATDHPIASLVADADIINRDLLKARTSEIGAAAHDYEHRRGRLPPPGFDKWFDFAVGHDAMLIEQFFDPLYDSLDLLWTVPAGEVREFATTWPYVISVRNGQTRRWEQETGVFNNPMDVWQAALDRLPLTELPDVDLAFNPMDEPKVFLPWSFRDEAFKLSKTTSDDGRTLITSYESLPVLQDNSKRPSKEYPFPSFSDDLAIWTLARDGCSPSTPGNRADNPKNYSAPALGGFASSETLPYMSQGFIGPSNYSESKSACLNPSLRALHGSFIAPQRTSYLRSDSSKWALITRPVPLLSSCRIHDVTADIPIPGGVYFDSINKDSDHNTALHTPWEEKRDKVFWRGVASGGHNDADNWTRFQRHRFVSMLNGTQVSDTLAALEKSAQLPERAPGGEPPLPFNFPIPTFESAAASIKSVLGPASSSVAALRTANPTRSISDWLSTIADVGFTHLRCFPPMTWFTTTDGRPCAYSGPFYEPAPPVPFDEMFTYKYLPDIDGASWSGRFSALLSSTSLPLKSTIMDEWHDGRMTAWRDFVPLDATGVDLWGVLEYFIGFKGGEGGDGKVRGHDEVAGKIARQGAEWAGRVLRREDMDVYMYRLVLEIARVGDERRERMGFVVGGE